MWNPIAPARHARGLRTLIPPALALAATLACATAALAQGTSQAQSPGQGSPKDMPDRAQVEACAKSAGLPAPGGATQPTSAQDQAFRSCLAAKGLAPPPRDGPPGRKGDDPPPIAEKDRPAFDACAKSTGMPAPGSGTRPSAAQHDSFRQCLAAKGITPPTPPGPGKEPPK